MRRRLVRWMMVILCGWASSTASRAVAQRLPGDFVTAYRAALETMKDAYSKGTIRGAVSQESPQAGKSIKRRFVLRVVGNWFRLDATTTAQKGMGAKVGRTSLFLATPQVSFQGMRLPDGLLPNNSQIGGYSDIAATIHAICPLSFPYTMGTQGTILDMLQSGGVKITSFKTGTIDGERMIQIRYLQQVDSQGRYGPWDCTIFISPAEGYALHSYRWTTGQGDRQLTLSGSLSYRVTPNGIPFLESLERREERGDDVIERQAMSVSDFDTTRPTNYYFTADSVNRQ